MVKAAWGTKRTCPKCAAKFYDLNKKPAHCPACEHEFDPEAPVKKRGKKKAVDTGAEQIKKAAALVKKDKKKDADDEEMPGFTDLEVIEDMDDLDDLEDVEDIKGKKPAAGADEEEDEEAFIDDDAPIDDKFDEDDEE